MLVIRLRPGCHHFWHTLLAREYSSQDMQVLSGMIKQLEVHNKELRHDAAELMEVCEALEFDNRRMSHETLVSRSHQEKNAMMSS